MEYRKKHTLLSKVLSLILVIILATIPFSSLPAHASSSNGDEIIAFTSDVHNEPDNTSADRLGDWIDSVNSYVGGSGIDFMTFCGDMGKSSGEGPTNSSVGNHYWEWVQAAMAVADTKLGKANTAYTTGNHELDSSDGKYNLNTTYTEEPQSRYTIDDLVKSTPYYEIYCMGSTSSNQSNNGYSSSQLTKLNNYFNGISKGSTKIYFIASHYPLHIYGSRATKNADTVISAINDAVNDKDITVVFIWGHNHTESDNNYDIIYKPKDSLSYARNSSTTLRFYYAPAGCMSDSENSTGHGGNIKPKGLMCRIPTDGSAARFAYFDKNYNLINQEIVMENNSSTTTYSVNYAANGATGGSVPVDNTQYATGAQVKVLGNTGNLTRTGYHFGGWSYKSQTYNENNTFNITENTTLTAIWTLNTYKVQFLPGASSGVTGSMADQTFTYNESKALTANTYVRDQYTFTGWKDESGVSYQDKATVSNLTATDGGVVKLTAQWQSNGTSPDPVATARENALSTINAVISNSNLANYKDEQKATLRSLVNQYTTSINNASTVNQINNLLSEFNSAVDAVPTATEVDLQNAKDSALNEINRVISNNNLANYKDEQKATLRSLATQYTNTINNATTVSQVNSHLSAFNSAVAEVPTAAAIDLQSAKDSALAEINEVISNSNLANYKDEQKATLRSLATQYTNSINNASTVSQVNSYLSAFNSAVAEIPTAVAIDLQSAKDSALAKINEVISNSNLANYKDEQKATLRSLATQYTNSINNATTVNQVGNLLSEFNVAVAAVPTATESDATALQNAKDAALTEINSVISNDYLANYMDEQKTILMSLVSQYTNSINSATTTSQINTYLTAFHSAVDQVPTAASLELQNAKEDATAVINEIISAGNLAYYKTEQQNIIKDLAKTCKDNIENADTVQKVETFLSDFQVEVAKLPMADTIDLDTAKSAALSEIDEILSDTNLNTYKTEQQDIIKELANRYKEQIMQTTNPYTITILSAQLRAEISQLPTAADIDEQAAKEAEEKANQEAEEARKAREAKVELEKNVIAAVNQINTVLAANNLATYKPEQQNKINELAARYKSSIEKAGSIAEISKLLTAFNTEISQIATAAQIDKYNNTKTTNTVKTTTVILKKIKAGKIKLTVKWTANAKVFEGYEISYRIKGKKWKKATVKGASTSKKTLKKLKTGKKYQVKVRGYKTVAGKKVYGKYSKIKLVKVK